MIVSNFLLTQLRSTKTSRTTMVKRLADAFRRRYYKNREVDASLQKTNKVPKGFIHPSEPRRQLLEHRSFGTEDGFFGRCADFIQICPYIFNLADFLEFYQEEVSQ